MIDVLWTILQSWNISNWIISVVCTLSLCTYLLIKEYGHTFISHILHRRNLPSLCCMLFFFCTFIILFQTGLFIRIPLPFRILLILLDAFYTAIVLYSVQSLTLFSKRYLKRYQKWLKLGQAHEHSDILMKMPWYFLDTNEKVSYLILKGKYLFEIGNHRAAYEVMSGIDQKFLYPEEITELTVDLVYMTLALGNFTKAELLVERIKTVAPPAYYFLKSYLSELQGDLDTAWEYARSGENFISTKEKNARILTALYTQLGRLSFFRNNVTEMFRYYYLALEQAKRYGDTRLLHSTYQNLISQIQMQHLHEDKMDDLMAEYTSAISGSSLQNMLEFSNFRISLARQQHDKTKEYEMILAGYRLLHQKTSPPEQYIMEMSTLTMLTNGDYDATIVLNDIAQHFDAYFSLPLPSRFIVLQGLTRPQHLTIEQAKLYELWTPKLVNYAKNFAAKDLEEYERTLPTDCVNERCWVIHQRIDFLRRSGPQYDGQQVLQWLQEIAQIYRDHNQAFHEIETEVTILRQFDEMIYLKQLLPDADTLGRMRDTLSDACKKSELLPAATLGGLLIDLAYFSHKLGANRQAIESLTRFYSSNLSSQDLSQEYRQKQSMLEQTLQLHSVEQTGLK